MRRKKIFFYHVQSVSFILNSLNCPKCCELLKKLHTQKCWNSQRNHNSQWYQELQRYRKSYIEYSGTIEYKKQQIFADSNGFIKYECCRHQHFLCGYNETLFVALNVRKKMEKISLNWAFSIIWHWKVSLKWFSLSKENMKI